MVLNSKDYINILQRSFEGVVNTRPRGMHRQLPAYGVGRGVGGVGEGLPELKISGIILSFKTFR